jgi:hypothetical protein
MTATEKLQTAGFEDVIVFDRSSYDSALIGVTEDNRAVYDYTKMVAWLVENNGMTAEEAEDWINYNTIGALPNAGSRSPIIMYPLD